jgi:hypothetical protein
VTENCGYGVAGFKKNSRFRNILESKTGGLYSLAWDTMEGYFNLLERQGITPTGTEEGLPARET